MTPEKPRGRPDHLCPIPEAQPEKATELNASQGKPRPIANLTFTSAHAPPP
jgi:hypothetical protein